MTEIQQKLDGILHGLVENPQAIHDALDNLDSIDLMELSMAIELHFGVSITGVEIAELGNLSALEKAIQSQITA